MAKTRTTPAILKNMVALRIAHKNLCKQAEDLPHMLLVEAPAGGGKTTSLSWLADDVGALYLRALATDSAVAFLSRLMNACGLPPNCTRGNSVMTLAVSEHLQANERTLIVDEGDFLFSSSRLIDTVRDIHDLSGMPVIIAGHSGIQKKIANRLQLYSRVADWLSFSAIDEEDLNMIARKTCGVSLDDALLKRLLNDSRGNLRLARVALERIANFAEGSNLKRVTLGDWGSRKMFLTHQVRAAA